MELARSRGGTGFKGVYASSNGTAYQARHPDNVSLGFFGSAEEAAVAYARAAGEEAVRAANALLLSLTADEALSAAEQEGLELQRAPSTVTGFTGVSFRAMHSDRPKPYQVRFEGQGLAWTATAEEGALVYARHAAALKRARAAEAGCSQVEQPTPKRRARADSSAHIDQ